MAKVRIDDVFNITDRGVVVSCMIIEGTINSGDKIILDDSNFTIASVEMFRGSPQPNYNVGLLIKTSCPASIKSKFLKHKDTTVEIIESGFAQQDYNPTPEIIAGMANKIIDDRDKLIKDLVTELKNINTSFSELVKTTREIIDESKDDMKLLSSKILSQDEAKHLYWIYKRLENLHNESPDVDYMIKLKSIINKASNEPVDENYFNTEDGWIKLDKKITLESNLPKKGQRILFINKNEGSGCIEIRYGGLMSFTPNVLEWYAPDAYEDEIFTVTHWRLLPNKPKN